MILLVSFYLLSILSNYLTLSVEVSVLLQFIIASIFSIIWAMYPRFLKSRSFKLVREMDRFFQTQESEYNVYVHNLNARSNRQRSGMPTDKRLKKNLKMIEISI